MRPNARREDKTRQQWIEWAGNTIDSCFYRPRAYLFHMIEKTFRSPIDDIAADYMRSRLRLGFLPEAADRILRFVYHARAGQIIRTQKPNS